MEFWEGAVLLVGGIWLVGRMHRNQIPSPSPAPGPVMSPSMKVAGPTSHTNLDGSGFLVSGETLATGTGATRGSISCPTCSAPAVGRVLPSAAGASKLRRSGYIAM